MSIEANQENLDAIAFGDRQDHASPIDDHVSSTSELQAREKKTKVSKSKKIPAAKAEVKGVSVTGNKSLTRKVEKSLTHTEPKADSNDVDEAKYSKSVARKVMNAIKELDCRTGAGVSLRELKSFLKASKKMDVKEAGRYIQLAIKKNMEKGILVREAGIYKMKAETKQKAAKQEDKKTQRGVSKFPGKMAKKQ